MPHYKRESSLGKVDEWSQASLLMGEKRLGSQGKKSFSRAAVQPRAREVIRRSELQRGGTACMDVTGIPCFKREFN